jgi:glucose-1-phosphate adenylyltransferase
VDILAAEQNVENENWYQGTADAVRQTMKHLEKYEYEYILISPATSFIRWISKMIDFIKKWRRHYHCHNSG